MCSRSRSWSKVTWYGHFCDVTVVTKCLLYSTVLRYVSTCAHFMKHHYTLLPVSGSQMSKYWNELLRHWRSGFSVMLTSTASFQNALKTCVKPHKTAYQIPTNRLRLGELTTLPKPSGEEPHLGISLVAFGDSRLMCLSKTIFCTRHWLWSLKCTQLSIDKMTLKSISALLRLDHSLLSGIIYLSQFDCPLQNACRVVHRSGF